ncbi:hypothetical protein IMSHALPRED_007834 [Imshaugia aleurites]|uniref:Uncharacterized protein n=1 Tax=Imshaugia aleurites TaxID=172621 RepID=A0A8H3FWV3_9LECA|nr:hypothetical protein IMSHALPRED_007834 [Imshaugia aleurites]
MNDEYLKEEDWRSQGYTHPLRDKSVGSKLTNDIHSLFSYELDEVPPGSVTKARWGKLELEEYKLLDQPLRLATQLIESAPSSDAICSITEGERYISPDNLSHSGLAVFEFRQHSLPSSAIREKASNILNQLGKTITFFVTNRDPITDVVGTSHGRTSPISLDHPEGVTITDRPEVKGLASMVAINRYYLNALKYPLLEAKKDEFLIPKIYFEFAVTICHEIMHAINFAIQSELLKKYIEMGTNFKKVPFNEPIHEGQRVAELGFFWEDKVFGGMCLHSGRHPEKGLFITDWPSWMVRDKEEDPERAPPKKLSVKFLVSTYYMKKIQTQEFWDKVNLEHSEDLLALRIRRRVGVMCLYTGTDFDLTWDWTAKENRPETVGNEFRVLEDSRE